MPTQLPQRKSPRLHGYDYSQAGAYFVTICTHQRLHLFGAIHDGQMHPNPFGDIAQSCWNILPTFYTCIELDGFVVMPNHVHGILIITHTEQPPTLGTVIGNYKGCVTRHIRQQTHDPDTPIWQTRFHDHIIRNQTDHDRVRTYIANNPALWEQDTFFT